VSPATRSEGAHAAPPAFSLLDAELARDPYGTYEALRRDAPAYRSDDEDFWVLSRHADVVAAARSSEVFSSSRGSSIHQQRTQESDPGYRWLPALDPPAHTEFRRMVNKSFTPSALVGFEPRVRERARALMTPGFEAGRTDWIQDVAALLPMGVIGELLGTDEERIADLRRWSNAYIAIRGDVTGLDRGGLRVALDEMEDYFRELIAANIDNPRPGIVGDLAANHRAGAITFEEIVQFCVLLLIGGNETTTNLIGNALLSLMSNPEEQRSLWNEPALTPAMIEETLRYDSPTQHGARYTLQDGVVADTRIPAGQSVILLWASANRDERVWRDADRFRIDRERGSGQHVAFGSGVHVCLGAALARLEARVVFEELLSNVTAVVPDGEPDRVLNIMVRGLRRLPVRFTMR
jgi:cytochrome P450